MAASFNECVNSRDLPRLTALMTGDHRFVDAASNTIAGKEACTDAWRGFLAPIPDYRNVAGGLVAGWHVRDDTLEVRKLQGISPG
jgi:hypothetical protein